MLIVGNELICTFAFINFRTMNMIYANSHKNNEVLHRFTKTLNRRELTLHK